MTQLQEREQAVPTREDTETTSAAKQFVPDVDIYEEEDQLVLLADLPGVKPEDLDIKLEKNILTILGTVEDLDVGDRKALSLEYEQGNFFRAFTLSEEIDQDRIEASLKDGVLKLNLPKSQQAKARKINVTAR